VRPPVDDLLARFRQAKAAGQRLAAMTAYDYPTARLVEEAGVDIILVGDSLGMVVLGHPDTTFVTLDDMVHHTRAAARGVSHTLLVADLPAHTYDTPDSALASARRLIDAGAQAVKLEGGTAHHREIAALVAAGIPVMGHIGMLPQSVREEGGYKIKGRTPQQSRALHDDARAVRDAGAFSVVFELVVPEIAAGITSELDIPTIGIGSGPGCDGQVLVLHDLVGLFPWFRPKFVEPRAAVAEEIRRAVAEFTAAVRG
jgi:3-methyl-2-oxobutanoate hydroxymethyltransferase